LPFPSRCFGPPACAHAALLKANRQKTNLMVIWIIVLLSKAASWDAADHNNFVGRRRNRNGESQQSL
jgi:hypothetical protein